MNRPRTQLTLLLSISLLLFSCGNSTNVTSFVKTLNKFDRISYKKVYKNLAFAQPLALVQEPGKNDRWYVVEKEGRIYYFENKNDVQKKNLYIDISNSRVDSTFEGGLLGMAFHPKYSENGYVFLSYTSSNNPLEDDATDFRSHISRFSVNKTKTKIEPDSEKIILTVDQPWDNHNGGNILFGPDGYLYAGFGDGGSWGDPNNNGQDIETLLGAMLRIDVNVSETEIKNGVYYTIPDDNPFSKSVSCESGNGCPEIFAWGLRNPWRWSFDRKTNVLWLGDVGQNAYEEIDTIKRGGNYGWRCREGKHPYKEDGCLSKNKFEDPIIDYQTMYAKNTTEGRKGASVTGGFVYRGSNIPDLQGYYLFADYVHGLLFALNTENITNNPLLIADTDLFIATFAEDQEGELYFLSLHSPAGIFKITGKASDN